MKALRILGGFLLSLAGIAVAGAFVFGALGGPYAGVGAGLLLCYYAMPLGVLGTVLLAIGLSAGPSKPPPSPKGTQPERAS